MPDEVPPLELVSAPHRLLRGFLPDLRDIWQHRELCWALITREVRIRYKGAKLGWLWSLARPIVLLLVYSLAIGVFLGANASIPEFGLYLYTGLILWGLFAQIINGSITSIVTNADLIRKAAFPRELLIIAAVVVAVLDFCIQILVLIIGYAIVGSWPEIAQIWLIVPAMLLVLTFGVGLGLLLSAANSRLRDFGFLTDLALQIGFWLVPIVYSFNAVRDSLVNFPLLMQIYLLNPMASAVFAVREALWPPAVSAEGQQILYAGNLGLRMYVFIPLGILFMLLCQRYFSRRASNFAQEL